MAVSTMNVSLTQRQAELIGAEVEAGHYTSASEFVRELVGEWEARQVEREVADLERAHAPASDRDTTPEEEQAILRIRQEVRSEMTAEREGKPKATASGRRT
jgi:Arc/MetJ-type ribon-helix-helix transcriptional regulator